MADPAWDGAETQLRRPEEVLSLSAGALPWDPSAVEATIAGPFWEILAALDIVVLVTREYEHLVVALGDQSGAPGTSVLRVPHPSGLVVDRVRRKVHIACTRNPNQVMELAPSPGWLARTDRTRPTDAPGLVPVATRFYPGCFYLHDLALVNDRLVGNAVGMNAVMDLGTDGATVVWWPRSIESADGAHLSRNLIQLNSIAAGASVEDSYFTASTETTGGGLPGDLDWVVEGQGVIFSGRTGEPVVRGLTRPHSARFAPDGRLWVDDSGFGSLNVVDGDGTVAVAHLPGWTRGLCLLDRYAIVGTSRVIPRFARYAPGLDVSSSVCGVHIVDLDRGDLLASLIWPTGNQIFAIDWMPADMAGGFLAGRPATDAGTVEDAWYQFCPPSSHLGPHLVGG
jgi:uncharacterized protein (TIGR03032 family)